MVRAMEKNVQLSTKQFRMDRYWIKKPHPDHAGIDKDSKQRGYAVIHDPVECSYTYIKITPFLARKYPPGLLIEDSESKLTPFKHEHQDRPAAQEVLHPEQQESQEGQAAMVKDALGQTRRSSQGNDPVAG